MPQKQRMECFRLLFDHLALIEHRFLSSISDSRKAGSPWGMMKCVGGVRKSTDQSWLSKGLGLGLLCWGFKGVQEEIRSEEASTLQIGSVASPPGQCTSPLFHPCHRLFDQDGHQDNSSASLLSRPFSLWLLLIPLAQRLSLWDNWGDATKGRSHKRTSMGPCRICWNGTTCALQPGEITSKVTRVSWMYYQ